MMPSTVSALSIGTAIVVAAAIGATAFALSNRYSTEVAGSAIVRTDHLTGQVLVCNGPGACVRWLPWTADDVIDQAMAAPAAK